MTLSTGLKIWIESSPKNMKNSLITYVIILAFLLFFLGSVITTGISFLVHSYFYQKYIKGLLQLSFSEKKQIEMKVLMDLNEIEMDKEFFQYSNNSAFK